MYVTIHPAEDEERYCQIQGSKFNKLFLIWFKQLYVACSFDYSIWHPGDINLSKSMLSFNAGMQHYYVDDAHLKGYCWYNNSMALLNVPYETDFFTWINRNGRTDFTEIADWFNTYTHKALTEVGIDACDVHMILKKHDPTFKIS